jgi:hypothetical protein
MTNTGAFRGSLASQELECEEKCQKRDNPFVAMAELEIFLVGPPGFEPGTNGL